ncbi:hypothetical protein CEXT_353281 [Caerostris extrusa]|uniref:Uncharacterized protein n=1 Tax=Caerostris extrusa TaxID=172846 RepID=A0AAV4XBD7_CAEEX|nr:hypothetical protein CEXT_353281 [Caerostris extrusa]
MRSTSKLMEFVHHESDCLVDRDRHDMQMKAYLKDLLESYPLKDFGIWDIIKLRMGLGIHDFGSRVLNEENINSSFCECCTI